MGDPQSQDAYFRLARLLIEDGQPNVAITFYYRLLKIQFSNGVESLSPRPLKLLVDLLHETGRYEEATVVFNALLDIGAKPGMDLSKKYIYSLHRLQRHGEAIKFIRREMQNATPKQKDECFKLLSSTIKEKAALDEAKDQLKVAAAVSDDTHYTVNLDAVESAVAIAPEMQIQNILVEAGKLLLKYGAGDENKLKAGKQYLLEAINMSTTNNALRVNGVVELLDYIEEQHDLSELNLTKMEELIRYSEFLLDNVPSMGFHGDLPPSVILRNGRKIDIRKDLLPVLQHKNYVRKGAWQRITRILAYVGNWEEAERQCTRWLNEIPDDISALSALAETYMLGFDNIERSVEILKKVTESYEIKVGNAKNRNQQTDLAFDMSTDGTAVVRLAHQIGYKDYMNGNYNRSKEMFVLANEISHRPGIIIDDELKVLSSEFIAKNDFAFGDVQNAISRLVDLKTKGLSWGGYRVLGDIYKQEADGGKQGYYKDAISSYRTAIKLLNGSGVNADLYYMLGSTLLSDGQHSEAAKSLRSAMSLQPNNSHVLNNLGVAYFHLNRRAEAQKLIELSVKLNDGCMARFNLGTFLFESRQFRSAAKHFRHALRLCREARQSGDEEAMDEASVQVQLAQALRKDPKMVYEALALYRDALKRIRFRGRKHNDDGNEPSPARTAHEMQVANLLSEIGDILVSLERYTEALDAIYEAMQMRRKHGDNVTRIKSRIDYGNALLYAGRLNEAKDQYEIVLKAAPTYSTAFNNLGVIAYRSRKFKEAIKWFQKVLKYEPRHVEAKLALQQLTSHGPGFQMPIVDDGVNNLVHKIVRDSGRSITTNFRL